MGYGLLALQAYLPSLHPPPCNIEAELNNCKEVHGWNAALLYTGLYMIAFGDGFVRVCLPSLGADQFDHKDPSESRQQSSFFNWYTFGISFGGFVGLIFIVWLENYKGWAIGLGVCCILILLGLLIVAAGLPFYRNQVPEGSPLTRILQVLVVAFRNRKLELPEKLEEAQKSNTGTGTESIDALPQTSSLKFLDKACINRGKKWCLVSLHCDEGGGDEDCTPCASSLHQLHDRIYIKHYPLHIHCAARWHDEYKSRQDTSFPGDTFYHPHLSEY